MMVLIDTAFVIKRAVFLAVMASAVCAIFAQNSVSLEAEIQKIEKTAAGSGITAVERHDALVRLARLRQLSGDIEGAAKNWLEAAAAIPGNVDDDALLMCAYCLAAMGEWDRASAALPPLLAKSARARFLDISIKAIKTGDVSMLSAIAGDPQYSQMKSQIIFMHWKTSRTEAAEIWRQRLVSEFPQSPEGRLAAATSSPAIIVRPSPFWLLMGGLDSLPLMETETVTVRPAVVERPAPAAANAIPVPQASAPQVRLQTGLYSIRDNAHAQMESLKRAGFTPSLDTRGDKWAVTVPAGADTNRTIKDLKDAGFDSFPIR